MNLNLRPVSAAVLVLLASVTASVGAQEARRSYIVQLVDKPAATYNGELSGLAATKPAAGTRIDVDAAAVQDYISYLGTKQADVMSSVSGAPITHTYNVVFNGFAAMLTDAEVRALKKNSGVANITADSVMQLDTNYTPSFLGINQAEGLWSKLGGIGAAGENIVIGIVDSGIWPENPAFADKVDANGVPTHDASGTLVYGAPPATWKGECVEGEGFSLANCNNKLIGARHFKQPAQTLHWTDFVSARDSVAGATGKGGHGTHTASTAGGNANVKVTSGVVATTSGIAPRARIAAYKVCWTDGVSAANGCATSNSVSAIEQAVKDGVNVINFSIGPNAGGGTISEATEVAFLGAASAGVFVATSAGNAGPTGANFNPTAHLSPWVTSVGNSTHNRVFQGTATLGSGVKLNGVSTNANNAQTPLILAKDAGFGATASANQLLCFGGADGVAPLLDPAKVAGKILVCDRGSNVLVNKSANAKTAGAAGMILANVSAANNTTLVAPHTLSTLHIPVDKTVLLKEYIAANPGTATAALGDVVALVGPANSAPIMNGSSSRGPNVYNANILKPDLTAPGTDILAGVTADLTQEQRNAVATGGVAPQVDWAFYTGTSMASPHVAGLAALLKQLHPTWTPMAIKSALMTTATDTRPDGRNDAMRWDTTARSTGTLPWAQGAGHVTPNLAANPGLVYDATEIDWARFACGVNAGIYSPATCQAIGTIPAYNLNLASLTAANVIGAQTLTRTVTNVSGAAATFTAQATLPGFNVTVTPPVLNLAAGAKGTFQVKLARTTAVNDTWIYGSLAWTNGSTTVRSPLTARSTMIAVPATIFSEAATGSKLFTIGTGFTGPMGHVKSGLLPAVQDIRTIGESGTDSAVYLAACQAGGGPGVNVVNVNVPAGSMYARFALFDEDTQGGNKSDLDLIVINPTNGILSSGNGGSNEVVNVVNPAAGNYKVCVIGYEPFNGSAQYALSHWVLVPGAINGNFSVKLPGISYQGGTASASVSWSGLGKARHLGMVRYTVGGVAQGSSLVDVDTTDPLPMFNSARAPAQAE